MLRSSIVSARGASPLTPSQLEPESISVEPETTMRVQKRNGRSERVNVDKIVRAVIRCCTGLSGVDALRVATKTIRGHYDGATTRELDQLSIQIAAGLIVEEAEYAKLAVRRYGTKNPFSFMALQDVQEVANFFERRVSAYQVGVTGNIVFDAAF